MGFYIETPEPFNKAHQLRELYGAENYGLPPKKLAEIPKGKTLVCVVENRKETSAPYGEFDAAGIVYDDEELRRFVSDNTGRKRTWMLMSTATLINLRPELTPYLSGKKSWRD